MSDKKTIYCSFCGKSKHEVRKLIAGPTSYICNECIALCVDIMKEHDEAEQLAKAEKEGSV